jgi:hypothetical protein
MALMPSASWGATTSQRQDVRLVTGSGDETMKVRPFAGITYSHDVVVSGLEMFAYGAGAP